MIDQGKPQDMAPYIKAYDKKPTKTILMTKTKQTSTKKQKDQPDATRNLSEQTPRMTYN